MDDDPLAYCIVWSPLPPITWIIPFIGHLGITDSRGIASDFRGPYYVGDDGRMAFGAPTRALSLRESLSVMDADAWDQAICKANQVYSGRMHNLFCDNCHSHVAYALNEMPLQAYGIRKWDMVKLAVLIFVKGRFLSARAIYAQFGPFFSILIIVLILKFVVFK